MTDAYRAWARAQDDEPDEPAVVPAPVVPAPVVPAPVVPAADPDKVQKPEAPSRPSGDYTLPTTAGMTDIQEYMFEQHGKIWDERWDSFPNIAYTSSRELALYGDTELEKRLGLPASVRAVQSSNGVLHEIFDPRMEVPKFTGTHDVETPHQDTILVH